MYIRQHNGNLQLIYNYCDQRLVLTNKMQCGIYKP
jgi:hypothetical protein